MTARDGLRDERFTAETLMRLEGDGFIVAAYEALLHRRPDPAGLENFRWRLRDGVSRQVILEEIARSDEGRSVNADLPGLGRLFMVGRLARLPVIGRHLARAFGVEADAPADRRMRAVELQVQALIESTRAGTQRIGRGLDLLRQHGSRHSLPSGTVLAGEQRSQLLAEHAADRKVWAIEQAEAGRYIAALQERSARAEEYAKSLEHERMHWQALQEQERYARVAAEQRIVQLESELEDYRHSGRKEVG